jgi:hypothetical protein
MAEVGWSSSFIHPGRCSRRTRPSIANPHSGFRFSGGGLAGRGVAGSSARKGKDGDQQEASALTFPPHKPRCRGGKQWTDIGTEEELGVGTANVSAPPARADARVDLRGLRAIRDHSGEKHTSEQMQGSTRASPRPPLHKLDHHYHHAPLPSPRRQHTWQDRLTVKGSLSLLLLGTHIDVPLALTGVIECER